MRPAVVRTARLETVRRANERRVVVLADGEDVEADLLGLERDGEHRLDPVVLARCASGRRVDRDITDGEDPEAFAGCCAFLLGHSEALSLLVTAPDKVFGRLIPSASRVETASMANCAASSTLRRS